MNAKTWMTAICLAACLGGAQGAGIKAPLLRFDDVSDVKFNAAGNARYEIITPPVAPPCGARCARITLGGINDQQGGSFNIFIPDHLRDARVKIISLWLRGGEDNTFGPVLLLSGDYAGYYCWRGPRNAPRAQLDVTDDVWARYEFHLNDFRKHGAERNAGAPSFAHAELFSLALGRQQDYPDGITFELGLVELDMEE